jgi:tRNA-specific 2-thiouridylase
MTLQHTKVVVAMSGGVDSSVAAALLVERGYEVIGIMMRLWSEPGSEASNRCCTPDAMAMARRVAAHLNIPFYALDAKEIFRQVVVDYFLTGYTQNITPNPCLACNRHVRWEYLLNYALTLGADALATGHYVRTRETPTGKIELLRGLDQNKDQSYILHILNQEKLAHALFPVGEFTKPQVRELARQYNLPVADRSESQDLCFLGGGDYRSFLARHASQLIQPGPIVNTHGEILGNHDGLAYYTIGQRKGLHIASPVPLYVLGKHTDENALVVGPAEALGQGELYAENVNWISCQVPLRPFRAQVKIRYKSHDEWGVISPLATDRTHIQFDRPLRDITPGQAVVFYDGDVCLGGGLIAALVPGLA